MHRVVVRRVVTILLIVSALLLGWAAGCAIAHQDAQAIEAVYLKDAGRSQSYLFYGFQGPFTATLPDTPKSILDADGKPIDFDTIPDGAVVKIWDKDGVMTASYPGGMGQLAAIQVTGSSNTAFADFAREEIADNTSLP